MTRKMFWWLKNVFGGAIISEELDRAVAIDFVKKSSNIGAILVIFQSFPAGNVVPGT